MWNSQVQCSGYERLTLSAQGLLVKLIRRLEAYALRIGSGEMCLSSSAVIDAIEILPDVPGHAAR